MGTYVVSVLTPNTQFYEFIILLFYYFTLINYSDKNQYLFFRFIFIGV